MSFISLKNNEMYTSGTRFSFSTLKRVFICWVTCKVKLKISNRLRIFKAVTGDISETIFM